MAIKVYLMFFAMIIGSNVFQTFSLIHPYERADMAIQRFHTFRHAIRTKPFLTLLSFSK